MSPEQVEQAQEGHQLEAEQREEEEVLQREEEELLEVEVVGRERVKLERE